MKDYDNFWTEEVKQKPYMILQKSTSTNFEMADFGNFLDGGSILLKGEAKHGGAEFCQTGFFLDKKPQLY